MLAELQSRFPCGGVARGAITELAEKYGVSKQLVQQIAKRNGYTSLRKPEQVCASCNGRFSQNERQTQITDQLFCRKCLWIDAACDECGVLHKRSAVDLVYRWNNTEDRAGKGQPPYTGTRLFCSRTCFGRWTGRTNGLGNPTHPVNQDRGLTASRKYATV